MPIHELVLLLGVNPTFGFNRIEVFLVLAAFCYVVVKIGIRVARGKSPGLTISRKGITIAAVTFGVVLAVYTLVWAVVIAAKMWNH